ncbi:nitrite reductase [Paenibacillus sp. VCA1]|uniref:nitrite reductase n=1 Tax=Paenibacillus sp. VCA1 TaxID=3039148 RepID=UPI002871C798|nr:nitrite reductase [Paenibacillus sp. VCA1]MDR9854906.1 nitrite reductase [Paenibacillus sp. VCA1]
MMEAIETPGKTKIAVSTPIQIGGNVITPKQLATIASAAGRDAHIEITPFRQIYVEVPVDEKERVTEALQQAGLEVFPAGAVVKGLIACQFCKGAEDAGLATAQAIHQAISGIATPVPIKVAYAGCALGTSEPLLKDIGIVKMKDTFSIYVGGEAKGIKAAAAELLAEGLEEGQIIPAVIKMIDFYKANAKGKEKFGKFIRRMTLEKIREAAGLAV